MFGLFKKRNLKIKADDENGVIEDKRKNHILCDKKLYQVDVNDNGRKFTVIRVGDNMEQMRERMSKSYRFEGYSFEITEISCPEGYPVKVFLREGVTYNN